MAQLSSTKIYGDLLVTGEIQTNGGINTYNDISNVPELPQGQIVSVKGDGLYVEK
jgi:hypothetical protein